MAAVPGTTAAAAPQQADPRRWKALAVVLIASFMILLDISIVNVAIPSVQRDLGATYAEIQWVLAGYQLAYAVVLITGGRLGDIFGRKRLFIIGVSGFTVASAGSASGVLTTVQQVGGALGVAVIGIIFFGQVSGYAPVVAQSSAQTLSAQLATAGVPQAAIAGATSTFTRCFVARSASSDPSATPPGCPDLTQSRSCPTPSSSTPSTVVCLVEPVAAQAVAQNFDHAFRDSLFFEMACFGLVFLMVFALPKPQNLYGPPGAGGGGH
jgi:hypothetical protein